MKVGSSIEYITYIFIFYISINSRVK